MPRNREVLPKGRQLWVERGTHPLPGGIGQAGTHARAWSMVGVRGVLSAKEFFKCRLKSPSRRKKLGEKKRHLEGSEKSKNFSSHF